MTVSSTSSKTLGLGNGVATAFPYAFLIPDANSIVVTYTDASGNQTVIPSTQYSVSGLGNSLGGTVTYPLVGSPIATGTSLLIARVLPFTQPTSLEGQGGYFPQSVEGALDRLCMEIQQVAQGAQSYPLALTYPIVDVSPTTVLPPAGQRANKYLAFNGSGNPVMLAATNFGSDLTSFPVTTSGGTASRTLGTKLADVISVKDFGAVGDGIVDDTAAIQAAINWAIYQNASSQHSLGRVFMPAGMYKTSDTLQLGYGTSFTSVVLFGEGIRSNGGTNFCGTSILPTFNDRPAIAIQGARNTVVRDLTIFGLNFTYVNTNQLGSQSGALNSIDDTLVANWIDPAFPAASSSQFAPYAGVAIDPYSGAQPATHYPSVTYPSFLGAVSQYNKSFSSNVLLENVQISGFAVGVAVEPGNNNSQGDFTKLTRVAISECQYGLSIGNTQSRLVDVLNSSFTNMHTGVTTGTHGAQSGKPAVLFLSTQLSNLIQWVNAPNTTLGGGPKFESCYGETIWQLGTVGGGGASVYPTKFSHCEFSFTGRIARGEPQFTLNNTGAGLVVFDSCSFAAASTTARVHFGGLAGTYRLSDCNTQMPSLTTKLNEKFALNATCGFTFDQLSSLGLSLRAYSNSLWNLSTGTVTGGRTYSSDLDSGKRDALLCVYSRHISEAGSYGNPGVGIRLTSSVAVGKGAMSFSVTGRSVSFDTGQAVESLILNGGEVGDCVWDDVTKTLFYVRSRTGSSIIMDAQTNYTAAGALRTALNTSGSLWFLNCRAYTTSYFLEGDTTSGSNVIANCGRDDGFGAFIATDIAVNDYLAVYSEVDRFLSISAAGNLITALDGGARTITTTGNLINTKSKQRLAIFWRAAPPNS